MKPLLHQKLYYLLFALFMTGIAWWLMGRETTEPLAAFKDEASARTYLRSEVAAGNMTQIEAQVRMAEVITSIQKRERKDGWRKAYADKVGKIMEEKGVSEEVAKALLKDSFKEKMGAGKPKSISGKDQGDGAAKTK